MAPYAPSDGDGNPDPFTVSGILVVLALGALVFAILYSALAPGPATEALLAPIAEPSASQGRPTASAFAIPSPQPPRAAGPATTALPATVAVPTQAATARPTGLPATAAPTEGPRFLSVVTNGTTLNLRAQPRADSDVQAVLRDGNVVLDLGTTRTSGGVRWRRVRTRDGIVGWASSRFLSPR